LGPWFERIALVRRLVLALLLLAGLASAPLAAQPAPAPAGAATRPALWVVQDSDTTIYLFGTIHLLKPGIVWFDAGVKAAFDGADELVLEVADQADPAAQARIVQSAMAPDGPPLSGQLPEAARGKLLALLAASGLPVELVERMKPWFAAITLTAVPLRKLGFDPNIGVEATLRAAAGKQGKIVTGLETSEDQLGMFNALSQELQIALLIETIDEQSQIEATLDTMIGAWSIGDPETLAASINGEMDDNAELAQRLLRDRNDRWADWIKARLARPGTIFLAVGAGHLAGTGSVQDALASRGVATRRLPNP
jgi:uncharacterized protein